MVAIIIPLYKEHPSAYDIVSLEQCFKVLSQFPIICIKPESMSLKSYSYEFSKVISFEDSYFQNIASYNKLMMSSSFYELFLEYKYILIHQTDAFVFKNTLLDWCKKNYDYIGAPWLRNRLYPDLVKDIKESIKGYIHRGLNKKQVGADLPTLLQMENQVGNGGLSLRKTAKFYKICRKSPKEIDLYLSRNEHFFNEDVFWSIEVNRFWHRLKIPSYKKAVFFSIENNPQVAMILTEGELPFGCHAWDRNSEFFRSILAAYGYSI